MAVTLSPSTPAADPTAAFTPEQIDEIKHLLASLGDSLQVSRLATDGSNPTGVAGDNGENPLDPPIMDPTTALLLLQSIRAKLGNEQIKSAETGVKANNDQQKAVHQERMDKLKEAAEAIHKASNSKLIGVIFGWIGTALAIVAAVAVAVVTFGAAAPASAAAIAGCVGAMIGATAALVATSVMSSPEAVKSLGEKGGQEFMYSMMAIQILAAVLSLGAGAAGALNAAKATADAARVTAEVGGVAAQTAKTGAQGGVAVTEVTTDTASTGAQATAEGVGTTSDVANTAASDAKLAEQASRAVKIGRQVAQATKIASGADQVGTGANQIVQAKETAKAENLKADAAEFLKLLKQIQQGNDSEIDFIKAVQEMLDKGAKIVAGVASSVEETSAHIVQQMRN